MPDSAALPLGGVIGIVVGGVVLVSALIIYMACRIYNKKEGGTLGKKSRIFPHGPVVLTNSFREKTTDREWQHESGESFRIDPGALRVRENRRTIISYDRPYSEEKHRSLQRLQPKTTVSNYGMVSIMSSGGRQSFEDPRLASGTSVGGPARADAGQRLSNTRTVSGASSGRHSPYYASGAQTGSGEFFIYPNMGSGEGGSFYYGLLDEADSNTQLLNSGIGPPRSTVLRPVSGEISKGQGQSHNKASSKPEEPLYATIDKRSIVQNRPSPKPEVNLDQHPQVILRRQEGDQKGQRVSSAGSRYDSFRSSNAVDLGAEPLKAWTISQYRDQSKGRSQAFIRY
ncbi:uncharacterized protein LOC128226768 [Mya arenaria]|uniref:uncharacterized protein LOC128226768 n=1 Tax=Mya arenaria TaxID=6604 RepID=UPI0022E24B63|nr:uncharacterized protein LOC128226768 [Mya arenaria]